MKFDRTMPGRGVDVTCRLENAKVYLEWKFYFTQEGTGMVRVRVTDRNGNVAMECLKSLQEEEPLEGILLQPHLWKGSKDPYMYVMEAILTDGKGNCLDRFHRQLPLRELRRGTICSNGELLLNGEQFLPKVVKYTLSEGPSEAGQQRRMLEDMQYLVQLGANCVLVKEREPARLLLQFCELCDRWGILVFVMEGEAPEGYWAQDQDRKLWLRCDEVVPEYGGGEGGLFLQESQCPSSLYYKYKAKWSDAPFVYLAPDSVKKLPSGNYKVNCYSNCERVALYTDGNLFEFQQGQGEFIFQEIPAKSPSVMLTAEGEGCNMSISMHKLLTGNFFH